jgi:hypothetical protein
VSDYVYRVNTKHLQLLQAVLLTKGFAVLSLDGREIRTASSLFGAIWRQLPVGDARRSDADWCNPANWDWNAAADFLWQGLSELGPRKIAMLWTDADVLWQENSQTFGDAEEMFEAVGESLRKPVPEGSAEEVQLLVFTVGASGSFSSTDVPPVMTTGL